MQNIEDSNVFLERVVWHEQFEHIYKTLEHFYEYGGNEEVGVLVYGPVGVGKSFLLKKFQAAHPPIDEPEKTCHRVIYIRVAPENTLSGLLGDILDALGDPAPTNCNVGSRRRRVKKQFTAQGVKMLMVDESADIIPRKGADDKTANIKLLRELTDDLKIPIILAGKESAKAIFEADEALCSRVPCRLSLSYFSCVNLDEALKFADYLDGLLSLMPRKFHGLTFIKDDDEGYANLGPSFNNLVRLVLATEGSPRAIRYLLKNVLTKTSLEKIVTMKDFADVWFMSNNLKRPLNFNPFAETSFQKIQKEAEKRGLYDRHEFEATS